MKITILLIGILSCPIFANAADQIDVKPGLWEVTNTTQVSGMPPIPNLDQMPPEQRARIEAAMKKMSGAPHTTTNKSCVTKEGIQEQLAKASAPSNDSCSPKLVNMTSSKVELHIECTREGGGMKSNGDVVIERKDSEHFTGTGAIKSSDSNGHTMDIKMSMAGRFLSTDCGDVKPHSK